MLATDPIEIAVRKLGTLNRIGGYLSALPLEKKEYVLREARARLTLQEEHLIGLYSAGSKIKLAFQEAGYRQKLRRAYDILGNVLNRAVNEALKEAPHHFKIVLCDNLEISRNKSGGAHAIITLRTDCEQILTTGAKQEFINEEFRKNQQGINGVHTRYHSFMRGESAAFELRSDDHVRVRYASGGALVVALFKDDHGATSPFFAFPLRPYPPKGLTIHIGASENSDEVYNPEQIVYREALEEMLLVCRKQIPATVYVPAIDRVAIPANLTLTEYSKRVCEYYFGTEYETRPLERRVAVIEGPDSVTTIIKSPSDEELSRTTVEGVHFVFTPMELGIEILRVLVIPVMDRTIEIWDGELHVDPQAPVLGRPSLLFSVSEVANHWGGLISPSSINTLPVRPELVFPRTDDMKRFLEDVDRKRDPLYLRLWRWSEVWETERQILVPSTVGALHAFFWSGGVKKLDGLIAKNFS